MSKKIEQQLNTLRQKRYFWDICAHKDYIEALEQISQLGTPYDAQYIMMHAISAKTSIANAAAKTLRKLLTKEIPKTPWTQLHHSLAYFYRYLNSVVKFKKVC